MTRRGRAQHRVDTTAKALKAEAIRLGAKFLPHDGVLDGNLWLPDGRIVLVDFKTPGAALTPAQGRLSAAGWPIVYLSTPEQVEALVRRVGPPGVSPGRSWELDQDDWTPV